MELVKNQKMAQRGLKKPVYTSNSKKLYRHGKKFDTQIHEAYNPKKP